MEVQEIQAVVLNILAFALLLITLEPPLDDGTFPLQQRLFPDVHGCIPFIVVTQFPRFDFRRSLVSGQRLVIEPSNFPNIRTSMVVLEKDWRDTGLVFEASLGSFTLLYSLALPNAARE